MVASVASVAWAAGRRPGHPAVEQGHLSGGSRTGSPHTPTRMDRPPSPLADLALLCLVVAHGTDADLDPRETQVVVEQLDRLAADLGEEAHSGFDLSGLVETAVGAYGALSLRDLDDVVGRLRESLAPEVLARMHAALVRVADADGVVHTMEKAFLLHLAQSWGLD